MRDSPRTVRNSLRLSSWSKRLQEKDDYYTAGANKEYVQQKLHDFFNEAKPTGLVESEAEEEQTRLKTTSVVQSGVG